MENNLKTSVDKRWQLTFSELPLGQCVELELPRGIPEPDIGVGHAPHARRSREGRCGVHQGFDLPHHLGGMLRRPLPVQALDLAGVVDLHAKIAVRDFDGQMINTTPGRIIFNEVLREAIAVVG